MSGWRERNRILNDEIVDCREKDGEYHWILANPQRLKKPVPPEGQPQPVWFKPFKE